MKRILFLFVFLSAMLPVLASNVEYGTPIRAEILSVKQADSCTIKAKLLEGCRGPDVFWTRVGTQVIFEVTDKSASFKPGQTIKVRWMKYGAMTPNGAVSGTSWELAP